LAVAQAAIRADAPPCHPRPLGRSPGRQRALRACWRAGGLAFHRLL